jgi:acyl-CoA dehydrogenase
MDFELTEEQTMVRDMARDFAEAEVMPRATQHDRQEKIDEAVFQGMGELGLWGLTVPEQYGGAGMGNLPLALVLEEINRACASTGVTLSVHNSLIGAPLNKFGTDAQKQEWLPKLATGEVLGAYCLTEPNAGSDAAALATTARLDGDHWVLDGTKIWVTNGGIAKLFIVYARTNPDVPRARGISAFLVPGDTPGLRVGKHEKKTGIRGSSTTEIELSGVRIPKDALLGELDEGFKVAMDTLDGGRIGIGAQAVGIGRACLDSGNGSRSQVARRCRRRRDRPRLEHDHVRL